MKMRLRGAVHRMIAGVDPRHRRDRAKLSDCRVGDLGVVNDIGVIVHRDFQQNSPSPDIGIGTELALANRRRGIDGRDNGKHLAGHLAPHHSTTGCGDA